MNPAPVSLIMIVRDEETNLPRCLDSVREVVDEIVVVDTGSQDRTMEVARSYGAHVLPYEWQDDFAAARNFARQQATGRWILRLDADEALAPEGRRAVAELAVPWQEQEALHFYFGHYLHFTDADCSPLEAQLDYGQVALFPNHPAFRFEQANYDILSYTGPPEQAIGIPVTELLIYDYGNLDPERRQRRRMQNVAINRQRLEIDPDNDYLRFHQCRELHLIPDYPNTLLEAYRLLNRQSPTLHPHQVAMAAYYGAFSALHLRQLREAVQLTVTGLEVFPHHYGLWMVLAGVYLAEGPAREEAVAMICRLMPLVGQRDPQSLILQMPPSDWGGLFLLGTVHAIRREPAQALPYYLRTHLFFQRSSMHLTCALDSAARSGQWSTVMELLGSAQEYFPHLQDRIRQLADWAAACSQAPEPPEPALQSLLAAIAQWREEWPPT